MTCLKILGFIVLSWISFCASIPSSLFYRYGVFEGDTKLSGDDPYIMDDFSSSAVELDVPIAFYNQFYDKIYINSNGFLSFDKPMPDFTKTMFPMNQKIIAPFLADVDITSSGYIYYRKTANAPLLERATKEIQSHFSGRKNFQARDLLIVTWEDVGHYNAGYNYVNTFQVVLASDSTSTYAFFNYMDDGIHWNYGEGKDGVRDPPAEAGFDNGDGRYYVLPGSGQDIQGSFVVNSNVLNPGVWMFQIGNVGKENVISPDVNRGNSGIVEEGVEKVQQVKSCNTGAITCHGNAACMEHGKGHCCKCVPPYYGNGESCTEEGQAQRINGKFFGTVNGVEIANDVNLHSYVVTDDGRAYTAISRVPYEVGFPLQTAFDIGTVIGWLYAKASAPAMNGYMITGGVLNRTTTLTYGSGEVLIVTQNFLGADENGYLSLNTEVKGTVPVLPKKSRITVEDYTEDVKRIEKGKIRIVAQRTYMVNDEARTLDINQVIDYEECPFRFHDAATEKPSAKLVAKRNFFLYDETQGILRFAGTYSILLQSGVDPCAKNTCHENAQCIPSGESYICECKHGYSGDGMTCQDRDECLLGEHNCDANAQCDNTRGSFVCRCHAGFRGDGIRCERDLDCGNQRCDANARCVYDPESGKMQCECNPGYKGDGTSCILSVVTSCNEVNNCHRYADCVYIEIEQTYKCQCVVGFSGDGFLCTRDRAEELCLRCSPNADCSPDSTASLGYTCRCKTGFTGDGYRCEAEADCRVQSICDANAKCEFDPRSQKSICICNDGYNGDGFRCDPVNLCRSDSDCDRFATCQYNQETTRYQCKCNEGYSGNGRQCSMEQCNENNFCDRNAKCVYDDYNRQYRCQCNEGWSGDGRKCTVEVLPCNQVNNCDPNADCLYDEFSIGYRCRCRAGYLGDGKSCKPGDDCRSKPKTCHPQAQCKPMGDAYECVCGQGYRGDGTTCTSIDQLKSYLLLAQGMSILRVPLINGGNEKGNVSIMVPGQTVVGIAVDCMKLYFYWTDVAGKVIGRAKLDGSDSDIIVQGLGSPEGIAVDWLSGNIYWTDSVLDNIVVAKLDGKNQRVIIDKDLVNPRAIDVDPINGKIYWTDWNRKAPKIERANTDGSDREVIVKDNLVLPNALVLDHNRQRLCWGDAGNQHIECSMFDGRGRQVIYPLASYPFGLSNYENKLYWTDWDMKSIPNIDIGSPTLNEPLTIPLGGNGKLYDIATVPKMCPRGSNACAQGNGGCRFLCLPAANGQRICACPTDTDERSCNEIKK